MPRMFAYTSSNNKPFSRRLVDEKERITQTQYADMRNVLLVLKREIDSLLKICAQKKGNHAFDAAKNIFYRCRL